jgi:EPS-associated MarR family transcriptional regulator
LIEKGWIKASNFKNSNNKLAYMYLLTRRGVVEKTRVTARFLNRKVTEYEALQREIAALRREIQGRK